MYKLILQPLYMIIMCANQANGGHLVSPHIHIDPICTVEFFDEERLLLKQELLEPEDEFSTITTTSFLKIPHTVLKAW